MAVGVSPTSISTTWSRIQCSNRNTAINRYVFFTYLGTTFINAVPISNVSDVNSYVASNLRPRTEYELSVRADNLDINGLKLSPLAVIAVSTAVPKGKDDSSNIPVNYIRFEIALVCECCNRMKF